nr:hypothetical protein [Desulfobulbaceae bacterium]
MKKNIYLLAISCSLLSAMPAFSQTIPTFQLNSPPTIDGNANDWHAYEFTNIPLEGVLDIKNVAVKSGIAGDEVFFIFQWQDNSYDIEHKPFIWNTAEGKYTTEDKSEDRFSINFDMEGDFTHDWLSGNSFKADMWHWKAARSNPIGLAQDKLTIITTEPSKKAYTTKAKNGQKIYILRPSDAGDPLYKTARYATKEQDRMPKYILNTDVKGSVADVKAKGVWENGQWTLELKRKLNTGNPDDRVFKKGDTVLAAIAVFDHSGDEFHNISKTLTFQY